MNILGPLPKPTKSETLGTGQGPAIWYNKLSMDIQGWELLYVTLAHIISFFREIEDA